MTLCVVGGTLDGAPAGLRAEDGRIAAVGADVAPAPGDDVLDARGGAIVPGLVNGHTHAAMTLLRGYGDDLPLMRWLEERIWPAEARLSADDVYWGTRLACIEMIRTGTVRFWDMYWHPAATTRAVEDAGMRATIGAPLIERVGDVREAALRSLEDLAVSGPLVSPALAPHAIYTVGEESLGWVAELAAERGLPVHIHLSETSGEVERCIDSHGVRPAEYLDRLGLLGPRTLLAHGVWLDGDELDLIAARGATLVTNPVANLKLAVGGVFPFPAARDRGVAMGLGTDGPASNNSLDLFQDMKMLALLQKHHAGDPAAVTAEEVWAVATGARSVLLNGDEPLRPGAPADFLVLRADAPELTLGDLTSGLVYASSGAVVAATVVAGRVLMRDGAVADEDEVRARVRGCAARLGVA